MMKSVAYVTATAVAHFLAGIVVIGIVLLSARSCFTNWGRRDLNPHEGLPRPLLRRLRLPFRHFPDRRYFDCAEALAFEM